MRDGKFFDECTLIEIGLRCVKLRDKAGEEKKRNVSQREFAQTLGIPHSAVSMIESGKKEMTMKELCAYQKKCNVSFDYLMGRIDIPDPDPDDMKVYMETGLNPETIIIISRNKKRTRYTNENFNLLDFLIRKGWMYRLLDDIYNYVSNEYVRLKRQDEYKYMIENATNDSQKAVSKLKAYSDDIGYHQYLRMKNLDKMVEQVSIEIAPILLKEFHGMDSDSILEKIANDEVERIVSNNTKEAQANGKHSQS